MSKLLIILLGLFIITSIFAGVYITRLENQIAELKALPGKITTIEVLTEDSSLVKKYSEVVNKLKISDIENSDLKKNLKATKSQLKELTELVTVFQDSLLNIPTSQDSSNDSVRVFDTVKDDFNIAGNYRLYDPYTINITKAKLNAKLNVYATQDKNGVWAVYGESLTKGLKIENIKSKVVPYKLSWYEKIYLTFGANYGSTPGVDVGVGTTKFGAISYGIMNDNTYWRYSNTWYPFRKIK